jgi:hypothetical protein
MLMCCDDCKQRRSIMAAWIPLMSSAVTLALGQLLVMTETHAAGEKLMSHDS